LSRVEKLAFCSSGLLSIHIPELVEMIGEWCFSSCDLLESITFGPQSKLRPRLTDLLSGRAVDCS
jgi:hypothetical protein